MNIEKRGRGGFTLIEIIIGIIALVLILSLIKVLVM